MPIYLYQNPKTEEVVEVIQSMKEPHIFIDEDGLEWKRLWTVPQASIDTQLDAFSHRQFVEKTRNGGTMGDLWDRSRELSEKRADKVGGEDPLKRKYIKQYEKERGGVKAPPSITGKKKEITIDFTKSLKK